MDIKKELGIEKTNCSTCWYLGSDDDGSDYPSFSWLVCEKEEMQRVNNLKSFPFKKEMECWYPDFWLSRFGEMVETRSDEEIEELQDAFIEIVDEWEEGNK